MTQQETNVARLYLPLLADHRPTVRQQACLIMLGTYGDRALTHLRRLIDDPDPQIRQEARLALLAITETTDQSIKLLPFHGMYIECLGRFRVHIGNHEMRPEDWTQARGGRAGWQKVQAILAYLVHCGRRGANRAMLGAAAWGGDYSDSSLARTLTVLQQALADHSDTTQTLVVERDYCLLDQQAYHTDVQLFERIYAMAIDMEREQGLELAVPVYKQALNLYGGPYMAGVAPTSTWCRSKRDFLMNSFVIAAERVAEYAYLQQQYQQCVDACTLALDADPIADELVIWHMRASAALGQRAEIEYIYRSYLRAAGLTKHSTANLRDSVVRAYDELTYRQHT